MHVRRNVRSDNSFLLRIPFLSSRKEKSPPLFPHHLEYPSFDILSEVEVLINVN